MRSCLPKLPGSYRLHSAPFNAQFKVQSFKNKEQVESYKKYVQSMEENKEKEHKKASQQNYRLVLQFQKFQEIDEKGKMSYNEYWVIFDQNKKQMHNKCINIIRNHSISDSKAKNLNYYIDQLLQQIQSYSNTQSMLIFFGKQGEVLLRGRRKEEIQKSEVSKESVLKEKIKQEYNQNKWQKNQQEEICTEAKSLLGWWEFEVCNLALEVDEHIFHIQAQNRQQYQIHYSLSPHPQTQINFHQPPSIPSNDPTMHIHIGSLLQSTSYELGQVSFELYGQGNKMTAKGTPYM